MSYDVGDARTFTYEVRDQDGALIDASSATLILTRPDGTERTDTFDFPASQYETEAVTLDAAGTWLGRWESTGVVTSEFFQFEVLAATKRLVGLDDMREHLRNYQTRALDSQLLAALDAVQAMFARRGWGPTTKYTEDASPSGRTLILRQYPVRSLVSVTAWQGGVAQAYSEYDPTAPPAPYAYVANLNAGLIEVPGGAAWPCGSTVRVVYTAGYTGDADVAWAVKEQVRLWFSEPNGLGSETYGAPESFAASIGRMVNAGIHPFIESMLPSRTPMVA